MTQKNRLVVVLHCPVVSAVGNTVVVSGKFLEEVEQYARLWPGVVRLVAFEDPNWGTSFGTVTRDIDSLPFELVVRSHDALDETLFAPDVSVVLSGIGHRYTHLAALGRRMGVPVVYVSEYSSSTQRVITSLEAPNAIVRARRLWWGRRQHAPTLRALSLAAGIQCNGTPTFEEYALSNDNRLLYFDSRITDDLVVPPEALDDRLTRFVDPAAPIHLVFSGRLTAMKGPMELVPVAKELRRLGLDFELSIMGGGELEGALKNAIAREGLERSVHMLGAKPFRDGLIPLVAKADLFVCPHPQGDPSCTYVETMACGVPVAGYANEALLGIADRSGAAWTTPVGDPSALAREIVRLADHRQEVAEASVRAREFAMLHTFDITYQRRIDHLRSIAGF